MKRMCVLLFAAVLIAAAIPPEGATLTALLAQLRAEEKADDKAAALMTIRKLVTLAPDHPALTARRARLAAANSQAPEAFAALRRLDTMQGTTDLKHADYAALANDPDFLALATRIARHGREQGRAAPAFTLATPGLVIEGMARDPASGDLLFADMHGMRIVRRARDGREREVTLAADWAISSVLGLKPDPKRNRLWVCGARIEREVERAALLLVDLKTLAPVRRIDFPADDGPHLCNDVDILGDGRVVLTDSEDQRVWTASAAGELLSVLPAGSLPYPNGVAVAADGRRVYVATLTGIVVLDTRTGRYEPLALGGQSASGIDGLYRAGDTLIGIQNGFQPMRVIAIHLTGPARGQLRVLAAASPLFDLPTTGAIDQTELLLIANAQFPKLERGKLRTGEKIDPIRVLRVPL